MADFDMSALLAEYRPEARQQLDALDRALVELDEDGELSQEDRADLLRQLHTLKGNSALLGLKAMVDQVHALENVFKSDAFAATRENLDRLFELSAALRSAVERAGTDEQDKALSLVGAIDISRVSEEAGETAAAAEPEPRSRPREKETESTPSESDQDGQGEREVRAPTTGEVVRVPFEKLDALLNRVAELFSLQTDFEELVETEGPELPAAIRRELRDHNESLANLAADLRSTTMDLRLVPLQTIFGPFPSLVRELAREQDKRVRLEVSGESLRVDKTAADALAEPLLHLLRNAVDHGIEPPEAREKAGKDPVGTIHLGARREGDRVRLEVSDDGGGIDRQAVLDRARKAGIAVPESELDLVFEAGLSTRETATTVSGRGIGLDIVRQSVMRLRGTLAVEERDPGTAFVLKMPLTLAIVPALIFESGGETFALPTDEVQETLSARRPERAAEVDVVRRGETVIPIYDPAALFSWREDRERTERFPIVIRSGASAIAIAADRLVDQRNIVVKPLPEYLGPIRGVSGATVAADGRVILLVDSEGFLEINRRKSREMTRAD